MKMKRVGSFLVESNQNNNITHQTLAVNKKNENIMWLGFSLLDPTEIVANKRIDFYVSRCGRDVARFWLGGSNQSI